MMESIPLNKLDRIPAGCFCGAYDCRSCHPENFEKVRCWGCDTQSTILEAQQNGWRELEGDNYCEHCIAELERAAEDDEA